MYRFLLFLLVSSLLITGCHDNKTMTILIDDGEGLVVGDKIVINGLEVGKISSTELSANVDKIEMVLKFHEPMNIPVDSKLYLKKLDVLGGKAIDLVMGEKQDYYDLSESHEVELHKRSIFQDGVINRKMLEAAKPILDEITGKDKKDE